jgi:hypothetical protein
MNLTQFLNLPLYNSGVDSKYYQFEEGDTEITTDWGWGKEIEGQVTYNLDMSSKAQYERALEQGSTQVFLGHVILKEHDELICVHIGIDCLNRMEMQ